VERAVLPAGLLLPEQRAAPVRMEAEAEQTRRDRGDRRVRRDGRQPGREEAVVAGQLVRAEERLDKPRQR